jgi:hypothetical protein
VKVGIVGASQAAFGNSIRIIPPPTRDESPAGGSVDPQALAVPDRLLPLAVQAVLAHA